MTGFGTATVSIDSEPVAQSFRITMKSVNHRHLDLKMRLGRDLAPLESAIAAKVRSVIQRGHVEVSIENISFGEMREHPVINTALVRRLHSEAASLATELSIEAPTLSDLLKVPGAVMTQRLSVPIADHEAEVLDGIGHALAELLQMRATEGEVLASDLLARSNYLLGCIETLEASMPEMVHKQQRRLRERINGLINELTALDPTRLEIEVALLADKCDVSEEVTRVRGHLMQFNKELMRQPSGSGKKLAFLTQELNREFNTIGSKIGDPELIRMVIDAKSELEKVREQVANLE